MNDTVNNVLATALNFNEELENEVNGRIIAVVDTYLQLKGSPMVAHVVRKYLEENLGAIVHEKMDMVIRSKLSDFKNNAEYINIHSALVKSIATSAAQEMNRNMLRQLTGSYNI